MGHGQYTGDEWGDPSGIRVILVGMTAQIGKNAIFFLMHGRKLSLGEMLF